MGHCYVKQSNEEQKMGADNLPNVPSAPPPQAVISPVSVISSDFNFTRHRLEHCNKRGQQGGGLGHRRTCLFQFLGAFYTHLLMAKNQWLPNPADLLYLL